MPSINVLDAGGATQTVQSLPAVGPAAKAAALPFTIATDDPLLAAAQAATPAGTNLIGQVVSPAPATVSVDITRPADTTAYAAGDALSNSTSSPTTGGFTFASAARASGKSVILSDIVVTSSAPTATALQGEVWIFDTAVTNINDNSAFAISDAEAKTRVAVVPFSLAATANNAEGQAYSGVLITTVGSADLRFLIRVTNAYVPISAEVITVRAKFLPVD